MTAVLASLAAVGSLQVRGLPHLTEPACWKSESGYLPVSNARKHLFYWYHEATVSPRTKPWLLWLNGGPGCSSVSGMMSELGPYVVDKGLNLTLNPYAWNREANVLFVEQPGAPRDPIEPRLPVTTQLRAGVASAEPETADSLAATIARRRGHRHYHRCLPTPRHCFRLRLSASPPHAPPPPAYNRASAAIPRADGVCARSRAPVARATVGPRGPDGARRPAGGAGDRVHWRGR